MEKLVQQILAYLNTFSRPKNWVLKLISFFFALFLWYFVAGEDKVDMNVSIPVEIVNLPRDMVISSQFKKQLEVTVSGQRSLIRSLSTQHISRTLDLSDTKPGKVVFENTADTIPFPWGISVLRLQPNQITLLIDRLIEKNLTIKPIVTGSLPEGYELISIFLEPETITITGSKTILEEVESLNTNVINIEDIKELTVKQVSLNLTPAITDLIGETVVSAHIVIKEKRIKRDISKIPLILYEDGEKRNQLDQKTITVQAELPYSLSSKIKDLRTVFRAKISSDDFDIEKNEYKVAVELSGEGDKYKDDIRIISHSPQTVPRQMVKRKKLLIEGKKMKIPFSGEKTVIPEDSASSPGTFKGPQE